MSEKERDKEQEKESIVHVSASARYIIARIGFVKDANKGNCPNQRPASGQCGKNKGIHNNTPIRLDGCNRRDKIRRGKGDTSPTANAKSLHQ